MNVVMNCVSRSVHAIFPWLETSGSVSRWLQRDLKSWPYPSWPIHPVDTYNLRDIGRGFSVSWGAGSVHMGLYGTAWTYICAGNMSLITAAMLSWHLLYSFSRAFSEKYVLMADRISYWALSPFVWNHSLACKTCCSFRGRFLFHLPQLAVHFSFK